MSLIRSNPCAAMCARARAATARVPASAQPCESGFVRIAASNRRAGTPVIVIVVNNAASGYVKALQHDLRHAAEECQELHDEVAKEKKLRAESEEALRMEQSVFAEAEMALRGKISEKAGALEAERRLRAEAEASLQDMAAVSAALGAERRRRGDCDVDQVVDAAQERGHVLEPLVHREEAREGDHRAPADLAELAHTAEVLIVERGLEHVDRADRRAHDRAADDAEREALAQFARGPLLALERLRLGQSLTFGLFAPIFRPRPTVRHLS